MAKWTNEDGTSLNLKPFRGRPAPRGCSEKPQPSARKKFLDIFVRDFKVLPRGADFDNMMAVCVGLEKPVSGCHWEAVAIHVHGGKAIKTAELRARERSWQNAGVAVVPLSSSIAAATIEKGKTRLKDASGNILYVSK